VAEAVAAAAVMAAMAVMAVVAVMAVTAAAAAALTDVWYILGGPGGSRKRRSVLRSAGGALRRRWKTAPLSRRA
jgi:hypothetical protein